VLADIESQRIRRLDGKATDFSPIDTSEWSPSGSVSTGTPQ
jgi:hypothetical protein